MWGAEIDLGVMLIEAYRQQIEEISPEDVPAQRAGTETRLKTELSEFAV